MKSGYLLCKYAAFVLGKGERSPFAAICFANTPLPPVNIRNEQF